jgi:hypothetical protein
MDRNKDPRMVQLKKKERRRRRSICKPSDYWLIINPTKIKIKKKENQSSCIIQGLAYDTILVRVIW